MYLMFIKPIIDSVFKIDELELKINSIFIHTHPPYLYQELATLIN